MNIVNLSICEHDHFLRQESPLSPFKQRYLRNKRTISDNLILCVWTHQVNELSFQKVNQFIKILPS